MDPEQYLNEVNRIITSNFQPDDSKGSMTAARAGYYVRQVTAADHAAAGFLKFKDVLLELERRGAIRIGSDSKGALAIWLHDQRAIFPRINSFVPTEPASTSACGPPGEANTARFRRLRNPVWLAFVGDFPVGRRFMHKETGIIRKGQQNPPQPSDEWAEITPTEPAIDKADAAAFLRSEGRDTDEHLRTALESPAWFREFAAALESVDPFLAAKWKRRRSNRVIAHAEQWRRQHGVGSELIYESRTTIPQPVVTPPTTASQLKDALLSAVRQMEVHDLLELRIPAKHLVAALRPELLNN